MKKKFASLAALSMTLTLVFGMTVSAAGSASTTTSGLDQSALEQAAKNTEVADQEVTLPDGTKVKVELKAEPVTVAQQDAAEKKAKADETAILDAVLQAVGLSKDQVKDTSIKILPGISISKPDNMTAEQIKEVGVPLEISNSQIESGKYYAILHTSDNGDTSWEKPVKAEGNKIKFTTYSFSTFTPVQVNFTEDKKDGGNNNGGGAVAVPSTPAAPAAPTAPQTGEALPIAGVLTAICFAGAAFFARKARA